MSRLLPAPLRRLGRLLLSRRARQNAVHEWRRRRSGEPALPDRPIRRVLVVCHGNICRSPFAERLLAARRSDLEVRSAGLSTTDGGVADPVAARVALRYGVDLASHATRRLRGEQVEGADLILGMEGYQIAHARRQWPEHAGRMHLLGDFLDMPPHTIEDPWGQSEEAFAGTFDQIQAAVERLAAQLPR